MTDIWSFLLQTLTASGVAALLLVLKAMLRDKLSPRWQFAAWGVLAVVLVLPAGRQGRYILFNWPFYVELLRSSLTGEYGALAHVAAPVPFPPLTAPRTVEEWLFALYCLGAAVLLFRYLISYVRLRLALKRGRPVEDGRVRAAAEKYSLKTCPAVAVEGLPSAFICGVLRPVLALPAGAETEEKVILHELLHLRYRDAAWGLLICLFRCLHWCNPLLWYCADLAGNDLESLCDQRVLERLEGEDRRDYGRILLSMADEKYARAPGTSSMANGGKNIRRRIEAIARFKRYPAGMGLVSVCVLLVLAAPLVAGTKAPVSNQGLAGSAAAGLAYARTVYCTTYAGAFDTYAKAVMTWRRDYRAMCAPLSEQNRLAEELRQSWRPGGQEDILDNVENSSGYELRNLTRINENTYEGLLVLELINPPGRPRAEDDPYIWMAVQRLRAEKEGDRWVVIPQEDFWAIQARGWMSWPSSVDELPAWEYEAQAGDFILRMRRQTASTVDSYVQQDNWIFGSQSVFSTEPQPGGSFETWYYQELLAEYTGVPENKRLYTSLGASSFPMWEGDERPVLRGQGTLNSSGSSSNGSSWGSRSLEEDWESPVPLGGGGSTTSAPFAHPAAYAADFYVNGEAGVELTLLPAEGGTGLE